MAVGIPVARNSVPLGLVCWLCFAAASTKMQFTLKWTRLHRLEGLPFCDPNMVCADNPRSNTRNKLHPSSSSMLIGRDVPFISPDKATLFVRERQKP